MDVKNEISEELRSLSAVVAAISRENPYRVPDGYFSDLAAKILLRTGGLETPKPLTFSVPDGYFEGFAQQVLSRIKAGAGEAKAGFGSGLTGAEGIEADRAVVGGAGAGVGPAAARSAGEAISEPDELPAILRQAARVIPYQIPEGYFE